LADLLAGQGRLAGDWLPGSVYSSGWPARSVGWSRQPFVQRINRSSNGCAHFSVMLSPGRVSDGNLVIVRRSFSELVLSCSVTMHYCSITAFSYNNLGGILKDVHDGHGNYPHWAAPCKISRTCCEIKKIP